ncbi:MAG: carbohydrate kinase family protein [Clostridia bacterium]|nr:carbohydrate kinase family protein [Clostridia bacterium]
MNSKNYVVGFGGANMDLHIRSDKPVIMRDSNPASVHTSPGGVMRNIMENTARLGTECTLLAPVGKDAFGDRIIKSCRESGINPDRLYISEDLATSSYMAFMDADGDMLLAANDMRNMDMIPASYLEENKDIIQGAKAIVCDANPQLERLEQMCEIAAGTPIFVDPVSVSKGWKYKGLLDKIYLIKPNLMELEYLSGMQCRNDDDIKAAVQELLNKGTKAVAVSLGIRGCYYADAEGNSMFRNLRPVENMANATGAGDAFTAGLVSAWCRGFKPEDMLDYALACGILAVLSEDTINVNLCDSLVKETIEKYRI